MYSITIFRYKYIVQTFTNMHSIHTAQAGDTIYNFKPPLFIIE